MFEPLGLGRCSELRLGWGGGATGGGHWLLVGSEPLREALIDRRKSHAGSAWFRPGIRASDAATPRGSVSYAGPYMDQA